VGSGFGLGLRVPGFNSKLVNYFPLFLSLDSDRSAKTGDPPIQHQRHGVIHGLFYRSARV